MIKDGDWNELTTKELFQKLDITQQQFEEANKTLTKSTNVVLKTKRRSINITPNYFHAGM